MRRRERTSAAVNLEAEVAGCDTGFADIEARPGSCREDATASRRRKQAASGSISAAGSAGSRPRTFMTKVSWALAGDEGTAKARAPKVA